MCLLCLLGIGAGVPEVMCRMLHCILEAVDGGLCLYAGGYGGWGSVVGLKFPLWPFFSLWIAAAVAKDPTPPGTEDLPGVTNGVWTLFIHEVHNHLSAATASFIYVHRLWVVIRVFAVVGRPR